jgi:23S rRNA pseudoU1915 N3-methylase RlmH
MKVSGMKISIFAAGMKAARELEQALWSYGDSLEEELSLRLLPSRRRC